MPSEPTIIIDPPVESKEVHQLPFCAPPTPAPTPRSMPNSLELHIPIPIPTPPTPLPIVIAYPLSQSPIIGGSEQLLRTRHDTMQTDDSGIELDPVPGPVRPRKLDSEMDNHVNVVPNHPTSPENEFELLDITEEELQRLDEEKRLHLLRALNVPLNIHRLRAMREKGKLPEPLIRLKYRARSSRSSATSGKENHGLHLTSILKSSDSDMDPEGPTEMERVQGESWYLPSATARRMTRQRSYRDPHEEESSYWAHHDSPRFREVDYDDLYKPVPIIPGQSLLDQFPLPPPSVPSFVSDQRNPYTAPLPPTPSPTSSSRSRPLGYMYAPATPISRAPSCSRSYAGSPKSSVSSSRTLTPILPPPPHPLQPGLGPGCYYAYDLLTPSPGAMPYSAAFGSARSVSPRRSPSVSPFPSAPQHSF